jgi:polyhydroxyalkanoate synthesis regulator phasin
VRGDGPERGSGVEKERKMREMIEDLRNEISELRNRIEKLDREMNLM